MRSMNFKELSTSWDFPLLARSFSSNPELHEGSEHVSELSAEPQEHQ